MATSSTQRPGVHYITLRDAASDAIRGLIADGTLQPGVRIFEEELAERLGVSRGPIREALRRFEEQGVVVTYPNRGSFVVELTLMEIEQLYELRSVLERMAVRAAASSGSREVTRALSRCLTQMRRATEARDLRRISETDLALHQSLWEATGNRFLIQTMTGLAAHLQLLMSVQNRAYKDIGDNLRDHEELYQAIRQGDADAAVKVMTRHLAEARRMIIEAVEATGSLVSSPDQRRRRAGREGLAPSALTSRGPGVDKVGAVDAQIPG